MDRAVATQNKDLEAEAFFTATFRLLNRVNPDRKEDLLQRALGR